MSTTLTNTNSKCIEDQNVIPKTLKFLEEKQGSALQHLGVVKDFLNKTPFAQE